MTSSASRADSRLPHKFGLRASDNGMSDRRLLYPPLEPFRSGFLAVGDSHELYFEECGNPLGKPVVFLHGGPGFGCEARHRRFFDPAAYRIVLFDQRGCGKSMPYASLHANTTWDLVSDMEKLRTHLGIERWQVFGGSWGSTLGLAYAETFPERVTALIVRGIFLVRPMEVDWFTRFGANAIFPDAWQDLVAAIPEAERGDILRAYSLRLTSADPAVNGPAAQAWNNWEARISYLNANVAAAGTASLAPARIESHYLMHHAWLEGRDLIVHADKLKEVPGVIVQGRYDMVCPMTAAWQLHLAWPKAELRIVPDAGHSAFEPGTLHELIEATDRFK